MLIFSLGFFLVLYFRVVQNRLLLLIIAILLMFSLLYVVYKVLLFSYSRIEDHISDRLNECQMQPEDVISQNLKLLTY